MPLDDAERTWFDTAPNAVQDRVVLDILLASPCLALTFLCGMGRSVHQSAIRVIFKDLQVEDDQNTPSWSPLSALLINPSRYGDAIRTIRVVDHTLIPHHSHSSSSSSPQLGSPFELASSDTPHCQPQPISTKKLQEILKNAPLLERFIWTSATCPPDGICEILQDNSRLSWFEYSPINFTVLNTKTMPRWDALSLPLLTSPHALSTLKISRLSHAGAQSLAQLLSELGEDSVLEDVSVETNWMDEALCKLLGRACLKARRLEIGSDGIRFNDKCISALLPLCESLTEFTLGHVQGRLSKDLWQNITLYPPLQKVRVSISEGLIQHTWSIDHLSSLNALPFGRLTHLSVKRILSPTVTDVHEDACMQPVPDVFAQAIATATALETLECDWWSWKPDALRLPLEKCKALRTLSVAFDGPFSKLFAMTLPFSAATRIETLSVFISEEHYPALSSSPVLSIRRSVSRSPSVSPIQRSRPLPSSFDMSESHSEEHTWSTQFSQSNETGIPLREIRKFVKRCSSIRDIIWYGRQGTKAHWNITYPTSNPIVVVLPPSYEVGGQPLAQEDWAPSTISIVERDGSAWEGALAEKYKAQYAEMKQREENATKVEKANRVNPRKPSLSQRPNMSSIVITPTNKASAKQTPSSSPVSPLNYQHSHPSSPEAARKSASAPVIGPTSNDTIPPPESLIKRPINHTASDSTIANKGASKGRPRARGRGRGEIGTTTRDQKPIGRGSNHEQGTSKPSRGRGQSNRGKARG